MNEEVENISLDSHEKCVSAALIVSTKRYARCVCLGINHSSIMLHCMALLSGHRHHHQHNLVETLSTSSFGTTSEKKKPFSVRSFVFFFHPFNSSARCFACDFNSLHSLPTNRFSPFSFNFDSFQLSVSASRCLVGSFCEGEKTRLRTTNGKKTYWKVFFRCARSITTLACSPHSHCPVSASSLDSHASPWTVAVLFHTTTTNGYKCFTAENPFFGFLFVSSSFCSFHSPLLLIPWFRVLLFPLHRVNFVERPNRRKQERKTRLMFFFKHKKMQWKVKKEGERTLRFMINSVDSTRKIWKKCDFLCSRFRLDGQFYGSIFCLLFSVPTSLIQERKDSNECKTKRRWIQTIKTHWKYISLSVRVQFINFLLYFHRKLGFNHFAE